MPEIFIKGRIQNKYETLKQWSEIAPGQFTPLKGEVCYAVENDLLYKKIGDGITDFTNLPWILNQGDNNETDETSPAYIKNKLAYPEYFEVPADEQIIYTDRLIAVDLVEEGQYIIPVADLANESGENYKNYILDVFSDTTNIVLSALENSAIWVTNAEDLKNPYNRFQFNILGENSITPWQFSYNEKTIITSNIKYLGYSISCIGNEKWGNLIMSYIFGNESPIQYFDTTKNLEDKFCIVTMGPIESDGETGLICYMLTDADVYIPRSVTDANTGKELCEYLFDFLLLETGTMHTIDQKYLGAIQSDNKEMNSESKSFIKNKFGTYSVIEIPQNSEVFDLGTYKANITFGSKLLNTLSLKKEIVSSYITEGSMPFIETCTVIIDDKTYENCPVFQRNGLLSDTNGHFIGNPRLVSSFYSTLLTELQNAGVSTFISSETTIEEDNGLPFAFCLANTEEPLWDGGFRAFEGYTEGSSLTLTVIPQKVKILVNPIDMALLPKEAKIGEYFDSSNSIIFNSGYEASGSNSISMGSGTKATNAQAVAIGKDTTASGTNSLTFGQNTIASGTSALAGGNNTSASGSYSIALGNGSVSQGENSFALGKNITTSTIVCTRPTYYELSFTAYSDISKCGYTHCSLDNGATWNEITSTSWSDNQCTVDFSPGADISYTFVQFRKSTSANQSSSIALGVGNVSNANNSTVLGCGNTSNTAYQTVIGKYNENDANAAFIIGNGGTKLGSGIFNYYHDMSRSNAFTVDWSGNTFIAGELSASSLSFNTDKSNITTKYLNLKDIRANSLQAKIKSTSSSEDLSTYTGEIHNKNWWPTSGWENTTHSGGTETFLDDGSYQLTYANGSTIIFNIDGSVTLNYIAGDTITITRSTSSTSKVIIPPGKYILSNGINLTSGIYFYVGSTSYRTNDFEGYSDPYSVSSLKSIQIGVRTSDKTTNFSTTFYPQLEMVASEVSVPSKYTSPKIETFSFNTEGIYDLDLLKYRSWDSPYFLFPTTASALSIEYYFKDLNKIPYSDIIISQAQSQNRYILDLTDIKSQGLFQANVLWDNNQWQFSDEMPQEECGLCLSLQLGSKASANDSWTSNFLAIPPSQLSCIDLFDSSITNSIMNKFGYECLGGYKLSNGYFIDSVNNWSISTEDLKDLIVNTIQLQMDSGNLILRKKIDSSGTEYCYLLYYIRCYNASNLREVCEMIATANKFIFSLPNEQNNIFLN